MSIHNSTKSKALFSSPLSIRYGMIIWPKGMSYSTWQNLLKRSPAIKSKKRQKKPSLLRRREFLKTNNYQKNEIMETFVEKITNMPHSSEQPDNKDIKLELITMLKHFLDRKLFSQHIENIIPDKRNQNLIIYSKDAIMKATLAIFLFREGSGNKFDDDSHDNDKKYSRANMAKFIDAPENCVPVIKTIETFMQNLEKESINNLMIAFFKDLQQSNFFKQHPKIMPGDFFLLAADCVHKHTYDHPHHVDVHRKNDCDCCLKRVYKKTLKKKKRDGFIVYLYSVLFLNAA